MNRPFRRSTALAAVGLVVATFAVYAQVGDHGFITLDDGDYVYDNAMVRRGLSGEGVAWAFRTFHAANWHPLAWLSHMLDCQLYGLRPGPHHWTAVALHALNAILLFLFVERTTRATWPALIVAALFAVHPLRVESVAWVAERKDLLAGLFWMLALLAYAAYARRPAISRYALVLLALALGLLAKPMLVSLPLVLLLLDVWPLGRLGRSAAASRTPPIRLLMEKVPLAVLAVASAVVTLAAQQGSGAVRSFEVLPVGVRLANAATAGASYLWKTLWPADLAIFYPHAAYVSDDLGSSLFVPAIGAGLLLAAITAAALWQLGRRPYLAVGWAWYLITLLPVVGIVQVGAQAMADRYTYLPLIGPTLAVVWGGWELATARPRTRAPLAALAAAAILASMVATRHQVAYWRDSKTLYDHALEVTSDNYLMHNSIAKIFLARHEVDRAVEHLEATLRIKPDFADPYNTLGLAALQAGRIDRARSDLERAVELWPDFAEAHNNLGTVLARSGHPDEAARHFERAIEIAPRFADAYANLGLLLIGQGRTEEAAVPLGRAVELAPDSADIHNTLGEMLLLRGDLPGAAEHLERALSLAPDHAEAHKNMGIVLARGGELQRAAELFDRALDLRPDYPEALRHLTSVAWILATSRDPAVRDGKAAVRWAERAAAITGRRDPIVLDALAAAYAEQGRWEEALGAAEQSLALAAALPDAVSDQIESRLELYRRHRPFVGGSSPAE